MTITLPNRCTARMTVLGTITTVSAPPLDLMTPWLARECTEFLPAHLAAPQAPRPYYRHEWMRDTCGLHLVQVLL